jgi:PAS domain S-box-containing protein
LNDHIESDNVIVPERAYDPSDPSLEIKRLQRCMNDLTGVLALPAAWRGREPAEILSIFMDSLMGMLTLDFLYVRVIVEAGEKPLEMLGAGPSHRTDEIALALDDWLSEDQIDQPFQERRKIGDLEISIFPMRMGVVGDIGLIVAGSQRLGFPEQPESLVLAVAANQLALGWQQALRLSEQKRTADEVDRRAAERTRSFAETNQELQLQAGLLQHLPVSAWTLKPDGTPDFVNRVWLEVAGQSLDFVRSHPEAWMTAVHPEDRETVSRAFWEGVVKGRSFAMESRTLCAQDGIYRWHLNQAVVLRDADGKVLKFVGTTTDIDDQKRAEEDARANELRLRELTADLDRRVAQRTKELADANHDLQLQVELLQRLPVSAWTLKPDGTPDFVNQVWLEYSGQTLDFVRSHPESWMAAVHPEDHEAASRVFWEGIRTGQGFAMETRCLRIQDGTYRWNLHQSVVLRDAERNLLKFVGTTTDIDDQKRAEEALKGRERDLKLIIDTIPALAWSARPDGTAEFFNQHYLDYLGLAAEEAQDWGWTVAVHPDDLDALSAAW